MSITYYYDNVKSIIYGEVRGSITVQEATATLDKITNSKNHPPTIPALWYLNRCDFQSIDPIFLQKYLDTIKNYPQKGKTKICFIVNDNYAYGMCRMYEIKAEAEQLPLSIGVHRDYAAGENWLLTESGNPD
jgi:hypothetical protein